MTERIRKPGTKEVQPLPLLRTGIEGYADGMRIFPRLKESENHIALQALREGKRVDDLRNMTPFRQYLGVERRAYASGSQPWEHSFSALFVESPSIDTLVSLGNFHTIRTWTWTLAQRHPDLNLPLEQFFQDALYSIVPYQARAYDPSFGSSFTSFVVELLKKRFATFVTEQKREQSSPVSHEDKPTTKKGRPIASKERVVFARLDAPMPGVAIPQTVLEYLETTQHAPQESTQADDREARHKIHLLAQLAGLDETQEETLVALYVDGSTTTQISQVRRPSTRMVRIYRQPALSKLAQLGIETVQQVLTEEYSTVELAKESGEAKERSKS